MTKKKTIQIVAIGSIVVLGLYIAYKRGQASEGKEWGRLIDAVVDQGELHVKLSNKDHTFKILMADITNIK